MSPEKMPIETKPKSFPVVYILHGKGGSPEGSAAVLEICIRELRGGVFFQRPRLPHADGSVAAERSVDFLETLGVKPGALLVGISLGGLVAAKLQESCRPDLHVIAISSPTWADGVRIEHRAQRRIALYSSSDGVIKGRISAWQDLAEAYDLSWLTHDTDAHRYRLAHLISAYMDGLDLKHEAERIQAAICTE
jgi:pimeloyl-ACP methyl ester carboxylesterase